MNQKYAYDDDDALVVIRADQVQDFKSWMVRNYPAAYIDDQNTTVIYDFPSEAGVLLFKMQWHETIREWDGSPPRYRDQRVAFGSIATTDERRIHKWVMRTVPGTVRTMNVAFTIELGGSNGAQFKADAEATFNARVRL